MSERNNFDPATCQLPFQVGRELTEYRAEVARLTRLQVAALELADQMKRDLDYAVLRTRTEIGYAVQREYLTPFAKLAAADRQAVAEGSTALLESERETVYEQLSTTGAIVEVWQKDMAVLAEAEHLLRKYAEALKVQPRDVARKHYDRDGHTDDFEYDYSPVIQAMRSANAALEAIAA